LSYEDAQKRVMRADELANGFAELWLFHSTTCYLRRKSMSKTAIISICLLFTAMMPAFRQAYGATQTIDGVVSDSMCGKYHLMPGKTAAQCVEECIKAKSSYVLVAGNKIYTLAAKPQAIAPFAGKHVQVQGEIKNNTIAVTTIR
jgi:hypothetical protein